MIVQPRGVPQSYLTLKWQILHFFAPWGPFCGSQRRAPDDGIVFILRVIPEILGSTRDIGFYLIFSVNPKFLVLPDILGIIRKRRTRPTSGALLSDWDPQKGPQGAKKVSNLPF